MVTLQNTNNKQRNNTYYMDTKRIYTFGAGQAEGKADLQVLPLRLMFVMNIIKLAKIK